MITSFSNLSPLKSERLKKSMSVLKMSIWELIQYCTDPFKRAYIGAGQSMPELCDISLQITYYNMMQLFFPLFSLMRKPIFNGHYKDDTQ